MNERSGGEESEIVDARMRLALARAGRQLAEQELVLLRMRIERNVALSKQLLTVSLANGDEPANEFSPSRYVGQDTSDPRT